MMLKILSLTLFGLSSLVSGTPMWIPLQSCPQNCRPNYGQNQQNQYSLPVMVQPNTPHQMPSNMMQQPNNQFYNQGYTVQNPVTTVDQTQPSNPVVNQISQMYMNKILSNPNLQSILDPNMFHQLGIDTRQANTNPTNIPYNKKQTGPDSGNPPQVINNYFILPPEYFDDIEIKEKKRPSVQVRERDSTRRADMNGKRPNYPSEQAMPPEQRRRHQNNRAPHQNGNRENQRRPKTNEISHPHPEEERERHKKRRKQDERHINLEREREHEPAREPHHIKRKEHHTDRQKPKPTPERRKPEVIATERSEQTNHEPFVELISSEKPVESVVQKIPKRKIKVPQNDAVIEDITYNVPTSLKLTSAEKSVEKSEQILNKKPRISKDDAIIEDFSHRFPGIPEEVVRKLLSYLRHQLQNPHVDNHPIRRNKDPINNFAKKHDHPLIFDTGIKETDVQANCREPNRRKCNKKPKPRTTAKPSFVETTTNFEIITTIPTTTETIRTTNYMPTVRERKKSTKAVEREIFTSTPDTKEKIEVLETTTTYVIPELGTENTVLDLGNSIHDDYYPDFRTDKQYFDSEEVYNVRNLRDSRYHYTTDRSYESRPTVHETNRNKLKKLHRIVEDSYEDVLPKPYTDDDISANDDSDSDIVYKTPPMLDDPNFRTKQLIKQKPSDRLNEISYKSSSYSDAKSIEENNDYRPNGSKKVKPDIETVYAHSKVVKYGKNNEYSDENDAPVVTYYLPDNMQYEDDGKTVIIAKSIPAGHFW